MMPSAPRNPNPLMHWRCSSCWGISAALSIVILSFWTLDLQLYRLFSVESAQSMGRFIGELLTPNASTVFLIKLGQASLETLAMSFVGTFLATLAGIVFAYFCARRADGQQSPITIQFARLLLNFLRSVPDLMWAALLVIGAGLGPMAGTLALALHTSGVLGRLFTEAAENAPNHESHTLFISGASPSQCFLYSTLPSILPQLVSYSLYRWENNIRAAAVLGVVGAGGLGQMLSFHMSLFQMEETSSVLLAVILLVILVDSISYLFRNALTR